MIALGAMSDMEDPPGLVFAIVTDPHASGLATATCLKPLNVTGTLMHFDFGEYTNTAPTCRTPISRLLASLANADDPATAGYIDTIRQFGERYGFKVEVETAVTAADYAPGDGQPG